MVRPDRDSSSSYSIKSMSIHLFAIIMVRVNVPDRIFGLRYPKWCASHHKGGSKHKYPFFTVGLRITGFVSVMMKLLLSIHGNHYYVKNTIFHSSDDRADRNHGYVWIIISKQECSKNGIPTFC